jgi:uncharacterized protein with HEPN domain
MVARSPIPRLMDIVRASGMVRAELQGVPLDAFEGDIHKKWFVERGIEIISEASRRLPDDLKARHPEIPWPKIAGVGNVLRHNYEDIAAPVLWNVVRDSLPALEEVCRAELMAARQTEAEAAPAPNQPTTRPRRS